VCRRETVSLNLESRDRIVPVLRALQAVYSDRQLTDQILALVATDINPNSRHRYWSQRVGRNLQTLGRLLIAKEDANGAAGKSQRKAA
jgi:hypothetical protein